MQRVVELERVVELAPEPAGVTSFLVHATVTVYFDRVPKTQVVHLLLAADCDSCRCLETGHVTRGRGRDDVLAQQVENLNHIDLRTFADLAHLVAR